MSQVKYFLYNMYCHNFQMMCPKSLAISSTSLKINPKAPAGSGAALSAGSQHLHTAACRPCPAGQRMQAHMWSLSLLRVWDSLPQLSPRMLHPVPTRARAAGVHITALMGLCRTEGQPRHAPRNGTGNTLTEQSIARRWLCAGQYGRG